MNAIICVGISASGKSTWAREYAQKRKVIITNRDDLRFSFTGAKDWSEYRFDKTIENLITHMQRDLLMYNYNYGGQKDVIIADTNLDESRRRELILHCKTWGYEVEIRPFPITLEEAIQRDSLRDKSVGAEVIRKQYQKWLEFMENHLE